MLKGLEVSEISVGNALVADAGFRVDSEFFRKDILSAKTKIERHSNILALGQISPAIEHPVELTRTYTDDGPYRLLLAQEVRSNLLALGDGSFLENPGDAFLRKNKLAKGDLVITRTGANFGQCAPVLTDTSLYACADLLIIRKGTMPAEYISTVMNTTQGRLLLDRGAYGMAQPHIAPTYLRGMPIPVFDRLVQPITDLVSSATKIKNLGFAALNNAEQILLRALGLEGWKHSEDLTYVRSSKEVAGQGRLDAQFFAPRVDQLLRLLSIDGLSLGKLSTVRHEKFEPASTGFFDYVEIGSIGADGTALAERLSQEDAPSRATQYVRAGDVITSTVRPIRRLSALIESAQDGFVCSSGFVVLKPEQLAGEVLLTYLRLPVIRELMDLHTSATMYPAISEADICALPVPRIPVNVQAKVRDSVREAARFRVEASGLLGAAKRAVEIAIDDSEGMAVDWLRSQYPQPAPSMLG